MRYRQSVDASISRIGFSKGRYVIHSEAKAEGNVKSVQGRSIINYMDAKIATVVVVQLFDRLLQNHPHKAKAALEIMESHAADYGVKKVNDISHLFD